MSCCDELDADGNPIPILSMKQGETFSLRMQYTEDDGITPKSLLNVAISSQIRDKKDVIVASLTVSIFDVLGGLYDLTASSSTATWPIGFLYWDIAETTNGVTRITNTERIFVDRAITK